jgi:hypothetical protein
LLLLLGVPLAAAISVAAVCTGAGRAWLLPGWVSASGLVVAVTLLARATWFPLLLLLAWAFALGLASLIPARVMPAVPAAAGTP